MINSSKPRPRTQAPNVTIHADHFQPFQSRLGVDTVVRLRFEYNTPLIERLKALLVVYQIGTGHRTAGGWLPKYGCWFCEPDVWPIVRDELLMLGHTIVRRP